MGFVFSVGVADQGGTCSKAQLARSSPEMYRGTPDESAFFSKNPSEKFHEVLIGATLKQLSQRVLAEIKRTVFV